MLFEDIELEENKDKKLSFIEKGLILTVIPIVKILLWKVKRAKTYGDLMFIGKLIESKVDKLEDKYGNDEGAISTEERAKAVIIDLEEFNEELKT